MLRMLPILRDQPGVMIVISCLISRRMASSANRAFKILQAALPGMQLRQIMGRDRI